MSAERKISITCAQIEQTDIPKENAESMIQVMDNAQTDVVVFPETMLSGLDKTTDLTPLQAVLAERAKSRKQWLVYGTYTKGDSVWRRSGPVIHNSGIIVDPKGEVRLEYHKNHLWNEPGVEDGLGWPVVQTEIGNLGIVICWDLAHTETIKQLVRRNAELVFVPSYWFGEEFRTTDVIEGLPLSVAFQNQLYLAYCDAYTPDGSTAARSKIVSPLEVLAAAQPQKRDIISAEVDLGRLQELRKTFDTWKN